MILFKYRHISHYRIVPKATHIHVHYLHSLIFDIPIFRKSYVLYCNGIWILSPCSSLLMTYSCFLLF